jgi:hypothetical protein
VGSFTDPQNLFLHFCKALEAAFDGQIPSGDHHPTARRPHGRQQHVGQVLETAPRLDF